MELFNLMSMISERCWNAGWMDGLEFFLWELINNPEHDRHYGIDAVTLEEVERLKALHKELGGWFVFDEESSDFRFLLTEDWALELME